MSPTLTRPEGTGTTHASRSKPMDRSRKGVSMRRVVSVYAMVTALTLAFVPIAIAQRISGEITGTVVDENGGVVSGVTVTATCPTTGHVRSTVSGETGSYRLSDLPVCVYKVVVTMQGFKTVNREVQAAVSTTTKADFRLSVGQRSEEVTVEGVSPIIEFSDKLNSFVDQDRIN